MYNNPIPIIFDENDEQWFFEPITRALNAMAERKIISAPQEDSDYFKITMPVQNFKIFSQTLIGLGIDFAGNCDVSYDSNGESLTADMMIAFEDYHQKARHIFLTILRENSPLPQYLDGKEKMSFCGDCKNHNCNAEIPYCVRLYAESLVRD